MPRARWPLVYAAVTAALLAVQGARREALAPADVVALFAVCAPLVWQRDRPLRAVCAIGVGLCAINALVLDTKDVTALFLLLLGPAFCLGRFAGPRPGLIGMPALATALPLADLLNPGFDPGGLVAFACFVVPAWGIGRAIGSRSLLVAELAAVNAALESEQAANAAAAAAAERARLARELHDIVAHALSVMVLQAAGARLAVERAPDASVGALQVVEEAGREAVAEMGRLLGVLRDDRGAAASGLARLDELVARARLAGLELEVTVEDTAGQLPPTLDLAAFRIAQEAVTNAVKHAAPTRARLTVSVGADGLHLVMEDDGRPEGPRRGPGTGHGLLGIRERVALHGGAVETAARRGGGFLVHARLPVA